MFIRNFPYTDYHDLNLDWLMQQITSLEQQMHDFVLANQFIYCGQWDINTGYQKYSIVVDNNVGYVSIQPVPSGIALNNTAYWVEIANFTALIGNLGTRMTAAENDIAALQNDMTILEPYVKAKESRLTSGTKIYCVGNSFAWGSGGVGDQGWPYHMQQLTGCTMERMCQNGGDFLSTSTPGATYPNMTYRQALTAFVGTKTADELAEYDYVIFGGGYNDHAQNYTSLVTEIRTTIQYVKSKFPNAKVVLIPLMATTFQANDNSYIETEYLMYLTAWANAAAQEGCLTCTNTHDWTYGRTAFQGSGNSNIHLNDDGYNRVARYMTAVINGWDGVLPGYYSISWETGITATYELMTANSGMVELQAQLETTLTSIGSAEVKIGSISTADYLAPHMLTHYFMGMAYAGTTFTPIALKVGTNGDISILKQSGTFTNSSRIYISTSWRQGV